MYKKKISEKIWVQAQIRRAKKSVEFCAATMSSLLTRSLNSLSFISFVGRAQTPHLLFSHSKQFPEGLIRLEKEEEKYDTACDMGGERGPAERELLTPGAKQVKKVERAFTRSAFPKHEFHSAENGILRRVVRLVLGWNLEHSWNGFVVGVQEVPNHGGNVLVDKQHGDVFSRCELLEGLFYPMDGRLCGRGEGEGAGQQGGGGGSAAASRTRAKRRVRAWGALTVIHYEEVAFLPDVYVPNSRQHQTRRRILIDNHSNKAVFVRVRHFSPLINFGVKSFESFAVGGSGKKQQGVFRYIRAWHAWHAGVAWLPMFCHPSLPMRGYGPEHLCCTSIEGQWTWLHLKLVMAVQYHNAHRVIVGAVSVVVNGPSSQVGASKKREFNKLKTKLLHGCGGCSTKKIRKHEERGKGPAQAPHIAACLF
jgi:hypothetical protein